MADPARVLYGAAAAAAATLLFQCGYALAACAVALAALAYAVAAPVVGPGAHDPRLDDPDDSTGVFKETLASLPSLEGKVVVITGATTGLGVQVARAAVLKRAALVILVNRSSERAAAALRRLRELAADTVVAEAAADFRSLATVREAAARVARLAEPYGGVDVLACNAGVVGFRDERTRDGYDVTVQISHHAHFLLTKLLLPSLRAAAAARGESRVVQHHSGQRNKVVLYEPELYRQPRRILRTTRLRGLSASSLRRRRDPSPRNASRVLAGTSAAARTRSAATGPRRASRATARPNCRRQCLQWSSTGASASRDWRA